jgi:phage shock protein PspC (stress-responsive transcriptional regulator)
MEDATASMGATSMASEPTNENRRGAPLPPPMPPAARPRWYDVPVARNRRRGALGGVITGLADAYGFDRRLARIVLLVMVFPVPALLLVYIAGWMFLPGDASEAQSLHQLVTDRHRLPLLILLGVALVLSGVVANVGGLGVGVRGFGWAVALILVGVMLWLAPDRSRHAEPWASGPTRPRWAPGSGSGSASTAASASYGEAQPTWNPGGASSANTVGTFGPAPVAQLAAPRVRRPIGSIAFALTMIGAGIVVAGDSFGWWHASTTGTIVTVTILLAAATMASAIANRRYGRLVLLPPLVALAAFVAATMPDLSGGVGERTVVPLDAPAAAVPQRLALGELTIDASGATGSLVQIDGRVGVGRLHVVVPAGAALEINSHVGAGDLTIDGGQVVSGMRFDHAVERAGVADGPKVVLDVRVGVGEIAVDHATSVRPR